MKTIGVGIIGFGLSGKVFHTPLLNSQGNFEIRKVLTSRHSEVKLLLPLADVVSELDAILNDTSIDLVINCAPNHFHYQYSARALNAGKHVVVEKPFVNNLLEGMDLIELAKKNGKYLTVFHNRRWDSDFLTLKNLIETDRLGTIKQFESHFDRYRPMVQSERWREKPGAGSGTFYDLGAHLIDQALNLFGMPDSIYADIENQRDETGADDYFHVVLQYSKTRVILHSTSYGNCAPRFQVLGSKASYIKYGLDSQEAALKVGMIPSDPSFGLESEANFGSLITYANDKIQSESVKSLKGDYVAFYSQLYRALIGESPVPPVSAYEALEVIRLIEYGYQSSREKKVIMIPDKRAFG